MENVITKTPNMTNSSNENRYKTILYTFFILFWSINLYLQFILSLTTQHRKDDSYVRNDS